MIVVDASVVIDLLLDLPPYSQSIAERFVAESPELFAPHLLDAEVAQVLRRYVQRGEVSPAWATTAIEDLLVLPIYRYPHTPLLERVFELRDNVTIYDALYLVLAEALGATLLTRDRALATVPGINVAVEVVSTGT